MNKELYQTFVNQFVMYDKNEVEEIINNPDSSDEAIAAAKYILSGESQEAKIYREKADKERERANKENELLKKKQDNIISDPSYENIKQIANDIRFMKNIIIIAIVFEIIDVIISFLIN